jgi:uncharacterized phage protein (TIGR01671 family)
MFEEQQPVSRALKFRAWDPETRTMNDEWIFSPEFQPMVQGTTVELWQLAQVQHLHVMQFIGVGDKNGQEIYEGDILLSQEENSGLEDELFQVVYDLSGFCLTEYPRTAGAAFYRNWFNSTARRYNPDEEYPSCYFQVVGHAYEPQELIERRIMALKQAAAEAAGEEFDDDWQEPSENLLIQDYSLDEVE